MSYNATYKIEAYGKDNDIRIEICRTSSLHTAVLLCQTLAKSVHDERLRNNGGRIDAEHGEPFDWIEMTDKKGVTEVFA